MERERIKRLLTCYGNTKEVNMVKKYDIITMGSGLVDAFLYTGAKEKNGMISFPVGTKIRIESIVFSVGGGGANTASCISKLGLKTGYLGKIGKGNNADIILREIGKRSVDFLGTSGVGHTGYSIVLESTGKNRTILTYKGESDNLKFSEINLKKLNTKWLYFTSMSDESFKSQKKLAVWAKKKGIKIAFNPSSYLTKKGSSYISSILKNTEFLVLNEEEAKMLVKKGDLFEGLRKLGPEIVCITNGNKEGGVYDGKNLYRYFPNDVLVSECTGAGDTFGSSFIAGLIRYNDIEKAIKVAMANSESLIKKRGMQHGLLSWNEVEKVIKKKKFRIKREAI